MTCNFNLIGIALILLSSIAVAEIQIHIVGDNSPPYMGEDLPDLGFLPDVANTVFNIKGANVKVSIVPWARAIAKVKSGGADAILGVYYTEERTQFLNYSNSVTEVQTVLFANPELNPNFKTLADLKGLRIGTVRGSSYGDEFDAASFLSKSEAATEEQNFDKLLANRIDLMAGARDVIYYLLRNNKRYKDLNIHDLTPPIDRRKLYIGFSLKNPISSSLRDQFNAGLKQLKQNGQLQKLADKHGIQLP